VTVSADVVVVTGAASGIGRATAERLLRDGLSVVGVDLDEAPLAELGRGGQGSVGIVTGDVVERDTHERAADAAEGLGRLRGWVNGAGIWA
jgi:NAD(P)-dependent dehydrogenase (short-subunit alcohol dehydrogenase family)